MPRGTARSETWALACTLAGALAACRQAPSSPTNIATKSDAPAEAAFHVELRDDLGRSVVVATKPKRILSLLPSFTETLFALGAGECVVGVDDFSDYPEATQQLPKLGGMYDTQLERALSLKPDLILLSESSAAVVPLSKAGVPVWAGSPRKFEDVYRVIVTTGTLVGRPREASDLVTQMRAEVARIEASVHDKPAVRVYYELDATPYSVGPASFIGVLLTKAGGENIVPAELGDFPKISPELVVSKDPSVILGVSLEALQSRPGWAGISALKKRRVYAWSGAEAHLVARPGPRLPDGLRALVRRLHPEAADAQGERPAVSP